MAKRKKISPSARKSAANSLRQQRHRRSMDSRDQDANYVGRRAWRRNVRAAIGITVFSLFVLTAALIYFLQKNSRSATRLGRSNLAESAAASPVEDLSILDRETRFFQSGNLTLVWDPMKPHVQQRVQPVSANSNVTLEDYAGHQTCVDCHQENYTHWAQSSHRWMNAIASAETIKADFSGKSQIRYRGGVGSFYVDDEGRYLMKYERSDLKRVYEIHQTIGSRFYQYFVGIGLEGPEPKEHDFYHEDHVLPFGFWIERRTWVPIVHITEELPDGERWEPVETLKPPQRSGNLEHVGRGRGVVDHSVALGSIYSRACNYCHTTFPLADMFVRMPNQMGPALATRSVFDLSTFVAQHHPDLWDGSQAPQTFSDQALSELTGTFMGFEAPQKASTLGISCEACHLGCRQHVRRKEELPSFAPQSPNLYVFQDPHQIDTGRSAANINATCGRCHAGNRPKFAAGISTWNSTEYTDALQGSCYSEASCASCHDPHRSIGDSWKKSADEDDASCIACHRQFKDAKVRSGHTRHPAGSSGDRCMNCHMPYINEGMQDVVRTHTIFSPTQKDMLEQNQPNACNLCHLDKSIEWTTRFLRQWYGREYSEEKITQHYASRTEPVGLGWLQQEHEATRLVAADAFARQDATWGLKAMVRLLDDPYLLNRQFAQLSIETLTGQKLDQKFGYWYYMTPAERMPVLAEIQRFVEERNTSENND